MLNKCEHPKLVRWHRRRPKYGLKQNSNIRKGNQFENKDKLKISEHVLGIACAAVWDGCGVELDFRILFVRSNHLSRAKPNYCKFQLISTSKRTHSISISAVMRECVQSDACIEIKRLKF